MMIATTSALVSLQQERVRHLRKGRVSDPYRVRAIVEVDGAFDVERMHDALRHVVAESPVLLTPFDTDDPNSGIVACETLDRYAASCEDLVPVALKPHSGPRRAKRAQRHCQPDKGSAGYQGQSPCLVAPSGPAVGKGR